MMMVSKLIIVVVGAIPLWAVPAQAATFNVDFLDPLVLGMPAADSTTGTVEEDVSDTTFFRRSPWDTTSHPDETYTAVYGDSSATYNFASSMSGLSLLWGSVDTYNRIIFYSGVTLVDSLTGTQVLDAGLGVPEGEGYANITISALLFDRAVFISDTLNSFEYSNLVVTSIPLPAAFFLYGAGMVILSLVGRIKRRKPGL
ncbi:MAG: hypothetical protein JKX94_03960 [Sneathiella sp.]|nr:hypothetical protein [Sneathiella sp.]